MSSQRSLFIAMCGLILHDGYKGWFIARKHTANGSIGT